MKGWKQLVTWIIRILTGATFVFSGFVKAVDPWGTIYKLEDYMAAMHIPVIRNVLVAGAFLLCAYEFCVGVALLLGAFRRSAPILACLFMGVMLPLTLWIAIADPVADCGCFGDAFVISNWATFWKNVALSAATVWLLKYNYSIRWLVRPHLQGIAFLATGAYISGISVCGYIYQALIDFRPYPIGAQLVANEPEDSSEPEYRLIYAKNGEEREFGIDDELPSDEEGWEFVRREEILPEGDTKDIRESTNVERSGNLKEPESESTFRIWSEDGEEDMTEEALPGEGDELILFMPDLANVSIATTWQINSLYTWATRHDIDMIGIASATPEEIENWRDLSLAAYPLFTAEDTEIKMVVRGNPAVVFIRDGKIIWKTTLRALGTEDFQAPDASADPISYKRNDKALLYNSTALYFAVMAVLVFLSLFPVIGKLFTLKHLTSMRRFNHDGKADHAESKSHDTPAQ